MLKYSPPLVQRGKATGRKIVRDAYAFDVDIPNRLIDIGVKRAVECVESMGADVIAAADHRRDEQRVIKVPRCAAELHKVAGQQPVRARLGGKWARAGVVVDNEVVQIRHARPCGRAIVRRGVIPAERRRVIHLAAAGIDALGHEIRTVAPDAGKIVKQRIAAVGPFLCIFDCVFPVVFHDFQIHHPAFSLCGAGTACAATPASARIPGRG